MIIRRLLSVLYVVLVFAIGFLVGQVWDAVFYGGVTGLAVDMPSDFIGDDKINVYEDRVVIEIEGARLSNYGDSGSMVPTLGKGVSGITVVPESPDDIEVGDIVSFNRGGKLIVHRVVRRGFDSEGVFFVTKGDNSIADDGKLRFDEIERVLVGLIY